MRIIFYKFFCFLILFFFLWRVFDDHFHSFGFWYVKKWFSLLFHHTWIFTKLIIFIMKTYICWSWILFSILYLQRFVFGIIWWTWWFWWLNRRLIRRLLRWLTHGWVLWLNLIVLFFLFLFLFLINGFILCFYYLIRSFI